MKGGTEEGMVKEDPSEEGGNVIVKIIINQRKAGEERG